MMCLALGLWGSSAGGKFVRVLSCWLHGAEVLGSDAVREGFQGGRGGADYCAVDFDDPGYYEEVAFPFVSRSVLAVWHLDEGIWVGKGFGLGGDLTGLVVT